MIIDAKICSNCRRLVPGGCDGRLYRAAVNTDKLSRFVCRGRDGPELATYHGRLCYTLTMGHGVAFDIPLMEVDE
jgi:hypothetical protein